jgi:hypothetical protein
MQKNRLKTEERGANTVEKKMPRGWWLRNLEE